MQFRSVQACSPRNVACRTLNMPFHPRPLGPGGRGLGAEWVPNMRPARESAEVMALMVAFLRTAKPRMVVLLELELLDGLAAWSSERALRVPPQLRRGRESGDGVVPARPLAVLAR